VFPSVADDYLFRRDLESRVSESFAGDRRAQLRQPAGGCVVVVRGVMGCLYGGRDDVIGRGEIGLSGAEADNVLTRRL
jgi:hypothetical protein